MKKIILFAVFAILLSLCPQDAGAGILNGGFEDSFSNWTTSQSYGSSYLLDVRDSFGTVMPTEGSYMASIGSGVNTLNAAELNAFLGLPDSSISDFADGLFADGIVKQGIAIKQSFNANAGDTLFFDWNYLVELELKDSHENDFSFLTLNDEIILLSDMNSAVFTDDTGTSFHYQRGFSTFSIELPNTGEYHLGFASVNAQKDSMFSYNGSTSVLLVDKVLLKEGEADDSSVVPEPATLALFGIGAAGAFLRRKRS